MWVCVYVCLCLRVCDFVRNDRFAVAVIIFSSPVHLHSVVKETIRLTELLLAVLIDGHAAMRSRRALPTLHSGSARAAAGGESAAPTRAPQAAAVPSRSGGGSSRNVPPEFQRRIIDAIRNKDTHTLLDSIENGGAHHSYLTLHLLNISATLTISAILYMFTRVVDLKQ